MQVVVSIGRLTAFCVVLVPMEFIPSEPPHSNYVIVSFSTLQKGLRAAANIEETSDINVTAFSCFRFMSPIYYMKYRM